MADEIRRSPVEVAPGVDHVFFPQPGTLMCVCGLPDHEHGPLPDLRRPLGYIVLTEQRNGSWRDDWDGCFHVDKRDAFSELSKASQLCRARLVACYPLGSIQEKTDPPVEGGQSDG